MAFTFVLFATCLIVSTVLCRSSPFQPTKVTYEDLDEQGGAEQTTQVVGVKNSQSDDDRSSNLSYVMAIRNSSIWSEVRKRSLSIETQPQLEEIVDKSPADLSDHDLLKLKRACNNGLKCVAVDQLMALKVVKDSTDQGSEESVRMAIVKITKVLTKYTTEYDEKTYRYEQVSDSDDATKVNSSVTSIVEDNRELCQIPDGNGGTYTIFQAEYKQLHGYEDGESGENETEVTQLDKAEITPKNEPEATPKNEAVVTRGNENNDNAKHEANDNTGGQNENIMNINTGDQNYGTVNNYSINYGTVNSATVNKDENSGGDLHLILGDDKDNRSDDKDNRSDDRDNRSDYTASGSDFAEQETPSASADNCGGANIGDNSTNVDVANSGSGNSADVRKGWVGEGALNNGKILTYNINKGTINKGEFNDVDAKNGIIGVGTVNNGPANYGAISNDTNNGTVEQSRNLNMQKYATNVESMYEDVFNKFVQNGIEVSE